MATTSSTPVHLSPPLRLVSLVPATTEILAALGLADWVVGRSHECDHPAEILAAAQLTTPLFSQDLPQNQIDTAMRKLADDAAQGNPAAASNLNTHLLESLKPDLIFTQALCGVCALDAPGIIQVAQRLSSKPQVIINSPHSIEGIFDSILDIASAIDQALLARGGPSNSITTAALELTTQLRGRMYELTDYANPYASIATVALIEWLDPIYIAGHWAPQLVERAGGLHPLNPTIPVANAGGAAGPIGQTQRHAGKSIKVPSQILLASQPDVLIIAPCGRTLDQAIADTRAIATQPWFSNLRCVQQGRVAILDGQQTFSRPGPRIVDAYAFLVGFLNDRPELIPPALKWHKWQQP